MRSRPRNDSGGFTLLECEVALLVLILLALATSRLTSNHEQLVTSMEDIVGDAPVWYLDAPDTELERALGLSALLDVVEPATGNEMPNGNGQGQGQGQGQGPDFEVTVLDVVLELEPLSATAQVEVVES